MRLLFRLAEPCCGDAQSLSSTDRATNEQKLLHTMAARFPEEPTENERETFKSFLHIFSRLYPCGEVSARSAAGFESREAD